MLFMIQCDDKPGHGALRTATREAHVAYLSGLGAALVHGGPLLDAAGDSVGSLLVVDQPSLAEAETLARNDPYAVAGLFASVRISAHRLVFRDGRRAG